MSSTSPSRLTGRLSLYLYLYLYPYSSQRPGWSQKCHLERHCSLFVDAQTVKEAKVIIIETSIINITDGFLQIYGVEHLRIIICKRTGFILLDFRTLCMIPLTIKMLIFHPSDSQIYFLSISGYFELYISLIRIYRGTVT